MIRLLCYLVLFGSLPLGAQSYDASLGLRIGTDIGATVQFRLPRAHKNFVLEGIVQSSLVKDQGSITFLGKQHQPLLSRRLNLFYGAGMHTGWTSELDSDGQPAKSPLGIDGVVGAEATFGGFNISYDFKPAINVRGGDKILDAQTAVSVRYVIAKRNAIWDKKKERANRRDRKQNQRARDKKRRRNDRDRSGKRWFEVWKN
ncbi:hypothetical protein [Neolewinella antarctica]|uniref:Outer membrane protein beta-barrel domain-containing protein n=1 Tax=Neolewinella antarctica TaxID=442734 RepID=A0ABX0X6E4_9BACT|nr:hypothetical protein [Neolewinella antarctica]NJC24777.1 hypothetical protein [Neolewinella antarctica]